MLTRLPINREHLCHTHAPTLGIKPGKVTNLLFLQIREAFANTHRCTDKAFIHHSKCKRKHNFSHFEIAVWQQAIMLQIPGRRGNHGNFFQNTRRPWRKEKGRLRPSLSSVDYVFLRCQWSGIPDADRDTFSDAPRDRQGPPSAPSFSSPFHAPTTPRFPPARPFSRGFSFFLGLLMTQA